MKRWPAAAVAFLFLLAAGERAGAADREHQQMLADIRMLQEQAQQLQLLLTTLTDTLKSVNAKLDQQTEEGRRALADQKVLFDTLGGDVRVLREKLDDTSVRLNSLAQEVDALRQAVAAIPGALPSGPQPTPGEPPVPGPTTGAAGTEPAAPPATSAPPPAVTAGTSPSRMFDSAKADYSSGQWALAIAGFESYLRSFPKTDQSDDAQFFIGEAYSYNEKLREAVDAYDRVIANYPTGDKAPDAYYKRGLALSLLGDNAQARESFDTVVKKFPNSGAAKLAAQVLQGMNRRSR
jgi:tol-pal system protein YbgF